MPSPHRLKGSPKQPTRLETSKGIDAVFALGRLKYFYLMLHSRFQSRLTKKTPKIDGKI